MPRPSRPAALLLAFVVSACVPPAVREQAQPTDERGLRPTFAPATEDPAAPPTDGAATAPATATDAATGTPGATPAPATAPPTAAATPTDAATDGTSGARTDRAVARIDDPRGDVEAPPLADTPAYADIVGAVLELAGDEATLSVALGDRTPERSDGRHTMNVASFYDVDGDGTIDYQVWANLGESGWGTSWFDDDAGEARYGADDEVSVTVEPDALVLRFPVAYLGGNRAFRWALASEWGTYEALLAGTMSEDHAPDEGRPARFPG